MSAPELLSWIRPYLEMNLLLAAGYLSLRLAHHLASRRRETRGGSRLWLASAYGALALAVALPGATRLFPEKPLFGRHVQVFSGVGRGKPTGDAYVLPDADARGASSANARAGLWKIGSRVLTVMYGMGLAGFALGYGIFLLRRRRLGRELARLPEMRRHGRVRVVITNHNSSPYSVWCGGRAWIALPGAMLPERGSLFIAIRHELQHHRQGDTRAIAWIELARALFFWNPATHAFARWVRDLQEFACDESLVGRRGIDPHAYGFCLLRAAEIAVGSRVPLPGTASVAMGSSCLLLRRRIDMMIDASTLAPSRGRLGKVRWILAVAAVGTVALMGTAALSARALVQDRTLTMSEARKLALQASRGAVIPVTVNEEVLAQLNRFVGTPDGRRWLHDAFVRMPIYREGIERKITDYALPPELLAVPLFESGFRNDVVSSGMHAKGLWQFIETTARHYGLVVGTARDERLDVDKETDAAMRYLRDLNNRFQDWRLALKSYNEGEKHVEELIGKYGTRDPWELERLSTNEHYLSGVTAAIILLRNPELLK